MKLAEPRSEEEKNKRVDFIFYGMKNSGANAIIFDHGSPEVWFQFYLGLFLDKPTAIIIRKKHVTDETEEKFSHPLVRFVMVVDEMTDKTAEVFSQRLAQMSKDIKAERDSIAKKSVNDGFGKEVKK